MAKRKYSRNRQSADRRIMYAAGEHLLHLAWELRLAEREAIDEAALFSLVIQLTEIAESLDR
jgi:hypothetical protein